MLRHFLLLTAFFLLLGCDFAPKTKSNSKEKQWVSITLESVLHSDTSDYYYFGQVSKSLFDDLEKNNLTGFFSLDNIRYVNDSNQLEVYEDSLFWGNRFFKKKDIERIERIKKDPVYTYNFEDLHLSAKIFLEKQ